MTMFAWASGLYGAISGAKIAIRAQRTAITIPATASGCFRLGLMRRDRIAVQPRAGITVMSA